MKTVYYIAYGSNLNLNYFLNRCTSAKILATDILKNKTLVFKGDDDKYSYLTIEDEVGSVVPVAIYEISYFDSLRLDKYEGFPMLYGKKYIEVDLDGTKVNALIYIMNAKFDYHWPSLQYFNSCLQGYSDFNFNKDILIKALMKTDIRRVKKR